MESYIQVQEKLVLFTRKYYKNLMLRGLIYFLFIGILYFLLISSLESFLWFSAEVRMFLFWTFLLVEIGLLVYFVGIPFFKLINISEGISDEQASKIIGRHFPEVDDKLFNLLQLKKNPEQNELLLASIQQRSNELQPFKFSKAVNYSENKKPLSLLIFPIAIILLVIIAGKTSALTNSFQRISAYNENFEKPAPFQFQLLNNNLNVIEGEDFKLQVKTIGDYFPENVQIVLNNADAFLKPITPGTFEYNVSNITEDFEFQLVSNEVNSEEFQVKVIRTPKLVDFEMHIAYPPYTGIKNEIIQGTGNATIPEGSSIKWNFKTMNTEKLNFSFPDTLVELDVSENLFSVEKQIFNSASYNLSTSNSDLQNFEPLEYRIQTIKDEFPKIVVETRKDTLDQDIQYFKGEISDDYGLNNLQLVYQIQNEEQMNTVAIPVQKAAIDQFVYAFPGNIELESGQSYTYYFEVFDNDGIHGSKSAKSEAFSYRKRTEDEMQTENLQEQQETLKNFDEQIKDYENSEEELERLSILEKEKQEFNYNEKKQLEEFLKRQNKQNEMMQNYAEKLEKSLEKNKNENIENSEALKERLKNTEERLQESEALLEELEKYSDKIDKEDLGEKLDELSKKNKTNKRSLEQILELTKQYYVEQKKQKLANDLEKTAQEQQELSEKNEENTLEEQEKVNKKFDDFQENLEELNKENESLKNRKDLGVEEVDEESVKKEQEEATERLENSEKEGDKSEKEAAKKNQKKAAQEMKEMSQKMKQSSQAQQGEQMDADSESLRQILDNLVLFSFGQEELLKDFRVISQNNPQYATKLKDQSNLRENFHHIDDSLYSLALRNAMINDIITEKLTDVEFNLEKSLERLSNNETQQGTASQQYVVTGANDLAILLDQALESMQNMMMNAQSGEGDQQEFQLPDIISKQQKLMEEMKKGMEEGEGEEGEKQSDQKRSGDGNSQGEGENGKVFEIYKEQQMLRMEMEKMLQENGLNPNGGLPSEMKKIEDDLLDKGFDPSTIKKMEQLEYELLEFEKANQLQGKDEKRKSDTNLENFTNPLQNQLDKAKEYFNSTEILNRQSLPLRQIYREKVKDYFGGIRD